jgi:4-carboxymuconolactone decarboxylase
MHRRHGRDVDAVDRGSEELLRRLALNDDDAVASALTIDVSLGRETRLDAKTVALVRLAGLVALQSAAQTYQWAVAAAVSAGAEDDELIDVLAAVAPIIGLGRLNRAAADIATALGYELDVPGRG